MSDNPVPKMLKSVPADKLKEIRCELSRGISPAKMAKVIQNVWGLLPKVKSASLQRCLRRYRETHVTEAEFLESVNLKQTVEAAVRRLDDHINAMEGYQELIQLQMRRVRMAAESEVQDNTLYKQTGFDIDVANRLLQGYVNTAVKAGVINQMIPEPEALPTVVTNEMATTVLHRPDLKQGLMQVIGNILQDVRDLPDDLHPVT